MLPVNHHLKQIRRCQLGTQGRNSNFRISDFSGTVSPSPLTAPPSLPPSLPSSCVLQRQECGSHSMGGSRH